MRANSITRRSFVIFSSQKTEALIKTVMESAHLLLNCTLPICTVERVSDKTADPPPSPRRGKEPARSIQIFPVCSHPSAPASASQSRSYFVLLFCAASPGTQMQSADFGTPYSLSPPRKNTPQYLVTRLKFMRRVCVHLSSMEHRIYCLPKLGIGVEIQYK